MESKNNDKDLVHYFSKIGKGVKDLFDSSPKSQTTNKQNEKADPETAVKILPAKNHSFSFGEVYANDLAKAEIEKDQPTFPVGSIIVREKNPTATSTTPETVIAMVKREKGFSMETGDWEFLVFNGKNLQMQKRETVGSCSACHSNAKQSDWVFRDYLK